MQFEIHRHFQDRVGNAMLEAFATREHLTLLILENPVQSSDNRHRVRVYFRDATTDLGLVGGTFRFSGFGLTHQDAITDYCKNISGTTLLIDDGFAGKRAVQVPQLI